MRHKILRIIVVILLGLFVFVKANPTDTAVIKINSFLWRKQELILTGMTDTGETVPVAPTSSEKTPIEEDQQPVICTMEYAPVCAEVQVECVRAPCLPIKETFGNRCQMNANKKASFLYTWECAK